MKSFVLFAFIALSSVAHADENIQSASALLQAGYDPAPIATAKAGSAELPPAHSIPWPVTFQDQAHTVANAMAQFQPFGQPYFHGGSDLRVRANAEVRSPVGGSLEAGHYGYSARFDGSMEKFWKPWPQRGNPTYFEVAVVTDEGVRYEFHHVNRNNLPAPIVAMLDQGGGRVEAGTLLGHAIHWMDGEYHHIHYNVILPGDVRVNPEHISPLLPDRLAPEIRGAFALLDSGPVEFGDGKFASRPKAFVLATLDRMDHSVYEHPVALARLRFDSGEESSWDFRQVLRTADGRFPGLWDYFVGTFHAPSGRVFRTEGGYGTGQSVIRIKVPEKASGPFTIELADIAGNQSLLRGELSN